MNFKLPKHLVTVIIGCSALFADMQAQCDLLKGVFIVKGFCGFLLHLLPLLFPFRFSWVYSLGDLLSSFFPFDSGLLK